MNSYLIFLFLLAQDPRLPPDRLPRSEPDVRGKILQIHKTLLPRGNRSTRGILLIEQLPTRPQSAVDKVYVIVGRETGLFEMRGTESRPVEFDNLKTGQEIKAWIRGGMTYPVYPPRLFAVAVAIVRPGPEPDILKLNL